MKSTTQLAQRISLILVELNKGKRIDVNELADEFNVSIRTIQRDIKERLNFLPWDELGPRFYRLDRQKLDILTEEDIQRFALFASVSNLFPEIDKVFYQEKLTQSVQVKGVQYENISHLKEQFNELQLAIQQNKLISFKYKKINSEHSTFYQLEPYLLTNKNGIWYLIGTDKNQNDKQKTFCFTQISQLKVLSETFIPNQKFIENIKNSDSLSHGNVMPEVVVRVSAFAAPFFLRRNLLPNQKLLHKLESGELLLSAQNISQLEILPLVQYWIPHLTIISPQSLQEELKDNLLNYLNKIEKI
ncbi:helix-turn-helix transcriptional regulator [Avibacterium paragallinarum]|nr:WYL domain-containing protein [Avibacterium paragallinarum]AZI13940.1 WYL domain-containing protein [Avibacterium paragallinarum]QIR11404.1 WYL domain-containing protein [Avibacterium paragallinarum]QJE09623.1 WYL domain-containing protein [Avibacterium paragallinarum]QJE11819.1 WYL domain-containing protein [Avibacterium paragallinarum]QJE14018.1 WYL domain-containing protein [Avibacterium paragallinarum]